MTVLGEAALSETERDAVVRIVDALRERFGDELRSVWLYGSRARGGPVHEESDVDLLVVTEGGRRRDFGAVAELTYDAAMDAGAEPAFFSIVVMSPERIADRRRINAFFIQDVDRDKLVLYGEP